MAGTLEGGRKAAAKNLARDPLFYQKIGSKGGKNGRTGGFAARLECECDLIGERHLMAQCAGKKGGLAKKK